MVVSVTGSIEGARLPRGNRRPAWCIAQSIGVRGAKVNNTERVLRAANPATTRAMSGAA